MKGVIRKILGPLFLIAVCPPIAMIFWHTNTVLKGDFLSLFHQMQIKGPLSLIYEIWSPYFFGTQTAWLILFSFAILQLFFMKYLPGKTFQGPISPKGNIPTYRANGPSAFFMTIGLFSILCFYFELFPATILYDHLGGLLGALNCFSLLFCLFLYFKGSYAPTSSDHGKTGNFIFDYYWGTELYPRICGWDLKMFTNCRFGMMGWGLLLLSYGAKQHELYGLSNAMVLSIALQFIYLTKFYFWETGYLCSLDIMHDRAGFYICWGCLVWVPAIYTSPTMYLVHYPNALSPFAMMTLFVFGASFILMNFWADRQRQHFRRLNGNCLIWKKKPQYTLARYQVTQGVLRENLLLASGWWGIARHFHYIPEILGALCWSLPALFIHFTPYFYIVFLSILLIDRAIRDDLRCEKKYGQDWKIHCKKVPYKILPFVY